MSLIKRIHLEMEVLHVRSGRIFSRGFKQKHYLVARCTVRVPLGKAGRVILFDLGYQHSGCCSGHGLVVGRRPGTRAIVVKPPHGAVGQEPPVEVAVGVSLSRRKVAENLTVRRPRPAPAVRVARVESQAEPLALLDHEGVREPVFRPALPAARSFASASGNSRWSGISSLRAAPCCGR